MKKIKKRPPQVIFGFSDRQPLPKFNTFFVLLCRASRRWKRQAYRWRTFRGPSEPSSKFSRSFLFCISNIAEAGQNGKLIDTQRERISCRNDSGIAGRTRDTSVRERESSLSRERDTTKLLTTPDINHGHLSAWRTLGERVLPPGLFLSQNRH